MLDHWNFRQKKNEHEFENRSLSLRIEFLFIWLEVFKDL